MHSKPCQSKAGYGLVMMMMVVMVMKTTMMKTVTVGNCSEL